MNIANMKKIHLSLTAALILLCSFSTGLLADNENTSKPFIIDVRSKPEYGLKHFEDAIHIPYQQIGAEISKHTDDKNRHIILYCGSGKRAGIAKETLESLGYTHVENAGGLQDLLDREQKPTGK